MRAGVPVLLVFCCLYLQACFGLPDGKRRWEGSDRPTIPEFHLLVGPTHTLTITDDCTGRLTHCVDAPVARVESITMQPAGALKLKRRVKNEQALLDITAERPAKADVVVVYEDPSGARHTTRFALVASKLEHVALRPICDNGPLEPGQTPAEAARSATWMQGQTLAVAANTELQLDVSARGNENQSLFHGDVVLFDPSPFAADPPSRVDGTSWKLVAPNEPGLYTLEALDGSTLDVQVYTHETAQLAWTEPEDAATDTYELRTEVAGAMQCGELPEPTVLWAQAEGDDCALVWGAVHGDGELPLLFEGRTSLRVQGSGDCTLSAHLSGEQTARLDIRLAEPSSAEDDSGMSWLGIEPVVTEPRLGDGGGSCDQGISNGKCEFWGIFPDGDCLTDADWVSTHRDHEGPIGLSFVGVGLLTVVDMGIKVGPGELEGHRAPIGVRSHYDERLLGLLPGSAEDVSVTVQTGCHSGGEQRSATLLTTGVGAHQIEFEADNINDTLEVSFTAWNANEVRMRAQLGEETITEPEFPLFEGSSLQLVGNFRNILRGRLRGLGPLQAVSDRDDSGARLSADGSLYVGMAPQIITTGSPLAPGEQRIAVVGTEAVDAIAQLPTTYLKVGEKACFDLQALDAQGRTIRGSSQGVGFALADDTVLITEKANEDLCVLAWRAGDADARVSWGAVSQVPWISVSE